MGGVIILASDQVMRCDVMVMSLLSCTHTLLALGSGIEDEKRVHKEVD